MSFSRVFVSFDLTSSGEPLRSLFSFPPSTTAGLASSTRSDRGYPSMSVCKLCPSRAPLPVSPFALRQCGTQPADWRLHQRTGTGYWRAPTNSLARTVAVPKCFADGVKRRGRWPATEFSDDDTRPPPRNGAAEATRPRARLHADKFTAAAARNSSSTPRADLLGN